MGNIFSICEYRRRKYSSWYQRTQGLFTIQGLSEKQIIKYQKNFWSVLNDRNKISRNILLNHHVKVVEYDGKKLLEIQIPAKRQA